MTTHHSPLGLPIGAPVPDWSPRPAPPDTPVTARLCRLERLSAAAHLDGLWEADRLDREGRRYTYLGYGPFPEKSRYEDWIESVQHGHDPLFHAIIDQASNQAVGVASYLRIEPAAGVIEVGHINYSPKLQGSPAATEAMFLMASRVFDELGYRRYEWKCDSLNQASRNAALRLGFQYEGIFRQAAMYKGRNRDTAWFGMTDGDWAKLKPAYESWLAPGNFDDSGRQRVRLSDLTRAALS